MKNDKQQPCKFKESYLKKQLETLDVEGVSKRRGWLKRVRKLSLGLLLMSFFLLSNLAKGLA